MKINKIQLKNGYKRFHDLTIDLGNDQKRIVALVGPNGCGKSSVVDRLLYHHNVHGRIGDKFKKDHTYHSMAQTPNFSYQNINIEFDQGTYQNVRNEKQQKGKENTILSFQSPYRYNSHLKVTESRATKEIRLNSYGVTTASDLDDKMIENYRRLYIKYNQYLNQADCKPSEVLVTSNQIKEHYTLRK